MTHYKTDTLDLRLMDCMDALRDMPDNSVDAIVTDPPYGLSFMGKKWDYDVPSVEVWTECLRVLKPGGHLLAFAGTRTQHRMAVRIEDAGFEIRDMIAWVYGSGFPKSLDVSKAIDKAAGAVREAIMVPTKPGNHPDQAGAIALGASGMRDVSAPATDLARQWQGWGTALKPALEPITVARKPLIGTVAENVLEHGTGAINVDECRVEGTVKTNPLVRNVGGFQSNGLANQSDPPKSVVSQGRWPANLIHDGSEEVLQLFPECKTGVIKPYFSKGDKGYGGGWGDFRDFQQAASTGSAARFFYCAKASKADRDEGCEGLEEAAKNDRKEGGRSVLEKSGTASRNHHPTVKPTDLMRYLCRLITPPNGLILDPFMGSGSTGKAAMLEGFRFIGIERDPDYFQIAIKRVTAITAQLTLSL